MEYRGIWISFSVLWFLLGAAVAAYPVRVRTIAGPKRAPAAVPIPHRMATHRSGRRSRRVGEAIFRSGRSMSLIRMFRQSPAGRERLAICRIDDKCHRRLQTG